MKHTFVLICALPLIASELIIINEEFDKKLALYNESSNSIITLTKSNKLSVGPFIVSDGIFIGDNSRYRVGNAMIENYNNGSYYTDTTLAWRLFVAAFGHIEYQGRTMSGLFRVGHAEFHLGYMVHNASDSCTVELDHFHFHELGNVRLHSSLPEFDGTDVSGIFGEEVLPKVNEYFDAIWNEYERGLEDEVCERTDIPRYSVLGLKDFFKD